MTSGEMVMSTLRWVGVWEATVKGEVVWCVECWTVSREDRGSSPPAVWEATVEGARWSGM